MTADFRSLLEDLVEEVLDANQYMPPGVQSAIARARAALAESKPEPPTQRQLLQLAAEFWPEGCEPTQAVPYARAVLALWGARRSTNS